MMKTLLSLFIAVIWLSGAQSAELTPQSGPVVITPGKSHTLTSKASGFTFSSSGMSWVREIRGKLQWIASISSDGGSTFYHDELKRRFTISRDNRNNMLNLKMDNMKTEDTGVYYSAKGSLGWHAMDVWGQGTPVAVTTVDKLTPQVFALTPYGQEESSNKILACIIQRYLPKPVTVSWSKSTGEAVSGEKNVEFPLSGDPLAYDLVSQITVSNTEWNNNNYSCNIQHYSSTIQKTIPRGSKPPELIVQILQGTCFSTINNQVELSCQAYNLATQDVIIKWFINEQEKSLSQDVKSTGKSEENYFGVQSKVNISMGEWNSGVRIKCHVNDTKTGKSAEAAARKCSERTNCLGIEVTMVPPTIEDLYVLETARIACVANNLKQLTEYSFDFDYPGAPATKNIQTEDPQMDENGIYSITSYLTVSPETWLSHTEFTCIFKTTQLPDPVIRTISKTKETTLLAPSVSVYPPSADDIAKDENCHIKCFVNGFYPKSLYMGWTEERMTIFKDHYVNSEPKRNNGNQSFSASSILTVPCSDWNEGKQYSCLVGHEANAQKFVRSPIDKNSGKPAKINVSVNMSDTMLSCM